MNSDMWVIRSVYKKIQRFLIKNKLQFHNRVKFSWS